MGEHDDEELQRAFRMSLQPVIPDAKRSKPRDNAITLASPPATPPSPTEESAEARDRRVQRELLAAAAEQRRTRLSMARPGFVDVSSSSQIDILVNEHRTPSKGAAAQIQDRMQGGQASVRELGEKSMRGKRRVEDERQQLPYRLAEQLHTMVFGTNVSKDVLAQWCNQGFRFSPDRETSLGLVQREGGPCGVLAPIQALVLKYLLFVPESEADAQIFGNRDTVGSQACYSGNANTPRGDSVEPSLVFSDFQRTRALVRAMGETLWKAGGKRKAILVVLDIPCFAAEDSYNEEEQDEIAAKALDGVALDSVEEFHRVVKVCAVTSISELHLDLYSLLPAFRSRMGALLFLFSVLLSRGLDAIQSDRDDPDQPLVTPPFGHASQEIVNLLLCGQAVPNVFDGSMDLGSGMFLKGIPGSVEVGFLTLLESLNLCKVGQQLKRPKWPIWVVGSDSHYTVLFALTTTVQDESDVEDREASIRQAFDAQDQSGGGGFISLEALHQLLTDLQIDMPQELFSSLCSSDIVVWNELWQALLQVDTSRGGLNDRSAPSGKKHFELYHFNGIAKTVATVGDVIHQRPKLTKLRVTVPPKWTPDTVLVEEYKATQDGTAMAEGGAVKEEPPQHAPLVDCVRTRWQRASCNWSSDAPSIV
ncbi:hypothetical protein R1flu_017798 [Riccia fluitans]|uniref:Deubiquitinating enzyme MINDY-3/4 conserved domain-containing protein n=1 Tax=Riccia fluitans TaxID=41844 RepID=A0ABD1ZFA3_9MARC